MRDVAGGLFGNGPKKAFKGHQTAMQIKIKLAGRPLKRYKPTGCSFVLPAAFKRCKGPNYYPTLLRRTFVLIKKIGTILL